MQVNQLYHWQMETSDGVILDQYDEKSNEQTWKKLKPESIVRVSFLPTLQILPRHDVFIDIRDGERFIKRFGRGFMKNRGDGFKLKEYLNCCVTNRYRFWVFSGGRTMVTKRDYEVYL